MSNLNLTNAIARLNELLELNPSYTKAKLSAFLTVEDYSAKVIKGAIEAVKPTGIAATGWQGKYQDWLIEAPRTEIEAYNYLMEQSQNVRNQIPQYLNIWSLSASIHSGVRVHRTMGNSKVEAEKEPTEIDLAWMNLKAEMKKARPVKTKVHPDRVSHIGDAELTKAYTEAFKKLNTKK